MAKKQHINGFDLLRIISVTAVIGSHTLYTESGPLQILKHLSFAVPCFVMMAVYLSLGYFNNKSESWQYFLRKRATRLIPAFLVWTAIYVTARWVTGSIDFPSLNIWVEYFLLGAAALHLYFIPLIFYYSVILVIINKSDWFQLPASFIGLLVSVCLQHKIPTIRFTTPEANAFPYYFIHNLPYLFIGIFFFYLIEKNNTLKQYSTNLANYITLIFGACTIIIWFIPDMISKNIHSYQIIRDSFIFLTFRFCIIDIPKWLISVTNVSFGIYLSHHLIFQGLFMLKKQTGIFLTTTWSVLIYFVVGMSITIGFNILLGKIKQIRWMSV
ncbi:MAG: acyltransferase [Desulfobacteraceae bacterium]|nr:acyltransferase [Desulfobacteraceae bacterium]